MQTAASTHLGLLKVLIHRQVGVKEKMQDLHSAEVQSGPAVEVQSEAFVVAGRRSHAPLHVDLKHMAEDLA